MAIFPTLSTTRNFFRNIEEVCTALVVYSVHNPGGVTNMWAEDEISFYKFRSEYENNKDLLAASYENALYKAINKYFPDSGIVVEVTTEIISQAMGTYKLIINITQDNIPVIKRTTVEIGDDGLYKLSI